jgi:hypothetical protein
MQTPKEINQSCKAVRRAHYERIPGGQATLWRGIELLMPGAAKVRAMPGASNFARKNVLDSRVFRVVHVLEVAQSFAQRSAIGCSETIKRRRSKLQLLHLPWQRSSKMAEFNSFGGDA